MKQQLFSNIAISDLCLQLALFLKAGLRLSDGLFLLAEEEKDKEYSSLYTDWAEQLNKGSYFYHTLETSHCFPVHMTGLLKAGEETGHMEETLFSLSRYYEDRDHTMQDIKNAFTYPIILFIMMIGIITVLLTKVLPVFEDVYASLGGSLHGLGGGLLNLGESLNQILPVLLPFLLVILLIIFFASRRQKFRIKIVRIWQFHYGDKGISRKMNDAHFAQALSMALSSGMPLEEGIILARGILKECPDAVKRCDQCLSFLYSGKDLSYALEHSQMLPASCCRMLSLGIRAGNSDQVMEDISRRLTKESSRALESCLTIIEPALVILTSLLVGMILFSVMLPLMNIMKTIG